MVLGALINHPERLNRETLYELRGIVARYPYFQTARLLMLNNMFLLHDPDFGVELRRSVFYISDRRVLCRLIEGRSRCIEPEEEVVLEQPSVDRTMSLIDAFLDTLPEENSAQQQLIPEVVSDYVSYFLSSEVADDPTEIADSATVESTGSLADLAAPKEIDTISRALDLVAQEEANSQQSAVSGQDPQLSTLIDNSQQQALPVAEEQTTVMASDEVASDEVAVAPEHEEEMLDESYFTETLAKIYIKQHKYSRALEIIRSLYLQFPEKNAYFADQIRFLEKLIINNNLK